MLRLVLQNKTTVQRKYKDLFKRMLLQYLNPKPKQTDSTLEDPLLERNVKPVHHRERPSSSVGRSAINHREPANMFAKIVRGPPIQAAAKLLARSISISHDDQQNRSRNIKSAGKSFVVGEESGLQSLKHGGPSYQSNKLEINSRILEKVGPIDDIDSQNDPIFTIPMNTHKLVRKIAAELSSFDPARIRQQKPVKAFKKIRANSVKPTPSPEHDPNSLDKSHVKSNKATERQLHDTTVYQSRRNNSMAYEMPPERLENETIEQFIERRLNEADKQQRSLWLPEQSIEEQDFQLKHFRTSKGIRVKRVRPRTASANPASKSNHASYSREARPNSSNQATRDYPDDPTTKNNTKIIQRRLRSFDSQSRDFKLDNRKESTDTQSTTIGNNVTNTMSIQYDRLQARSSLGTVVNVSTFLENSRPTSANVNNTLYSQKQRPATSSLSSRPNSANVNTAQAFMRQMATTANQSFNVDNSINRLLDATINPETTYMRPISSRTVNEAEFALLGQNLLEEIPEDQSVKGEKVSNSRKNYSDNQSSSRKESELDIEDLNVTKTVKFSEKPSEENQTNVSQEKNESVEQDSAKPKLIPEKKKQQTQIPEKPVENAADFVDLMVSVKQKNRELQKEYLAGAAKIIEEAGEEYLETEDVKLLQDLQENLVRQTNLEAEKKLHKNFEEDKKELDEMKGKIEELQAKWDFAVQQEEYYYEDRQNETQKKGYAHDEAFRGNTTRLTAHEINFIRQEFKKQKKDIQFGRLDDIVSRLKFFVRMNREVRIALLREANYVHYKKGETIFRMGDYGDLMYVILRGGCLVKVPQKSLDQGQLLTVASLYDGSHFGELAMIGTKTKNPNAIELHEIKGLNEVPRVEEEERKKKMLRDQMKRNKRENQKKKKMLMHLSYNDINHFEEIDEVDEDTVKEKNADLREELGVQENQQAGKGYVERTRRAATIEVSEDCDLLAINRETFKELYVSILQKDIDNKIKIIMQLPFFRVRSWSLIIYLIGDLN